MLGFLKELWDGAPVETLKQRMDFTGLLRNMQRKEPERRRAARDACRELVADLRDKLDQVPLEEAAAFMVGQRDKTTAVGAAFANLERALDAMMPAADSDDPAVRECAFTTVAQIVTGHTRAGMAATRLQRGFLMMFLSRGLQDKDPSVRNATAMAFGEYLASAEFVNEYLRQAVSGLVERLNEPDPAIRETIVAALRRGERHIADGVVADGGTDSPWPRAAEALGIPSQASAKQTESAATAVATLPLVPGSVLEAVEALLAIYDQNPDGFAPGYGDAAAFANVKHIGEALNEAGGMDRMLEAHAEFARRTRVFGADRNLEHAWDRIGEWLG
jgi:hypothetical protein